MREKLSDGSSSAGNAWWPEGCNKKADLSPIRAVCVRMRASHPDKAI
jgi:hypothetical protein